MAKGKGAECNLICCRVTPEVVERIRESIANPGPPLEYGPACCCGATRKAVPCARHPARPETVRLDT